MIAVVGATGTIGQHIANGLADGRLDTIGLVREPLADVPVPTRTVDLRDPRSVRAGLAGVDQLLLLTPHVPDQDVLEAAALRGAMAAGVRRIVKISGAASTLGPNGTTPTAMAHWHSERRIEQSGLGFCFLRPTFLAQNLLTAVAPTVASSGMLAAPMGHAPIAIVDARDVASCAVSALAQPDAPDAAWSITGPRPVTFDEIATQLGVPYVDVPPALAARVLRARGHANCEVEHTLCMAAHYASGAEAVATDAVNRLTGRPPRSVQAFLEENAGAFASRRWPILTAIATLKGRT